MTGTDRLRSGHAGAAGYGVLTDGDSRLSRTKFNRLPLRRQFQFSAEPDVPIRVGIEAQLLATANALRKGKDAMNSQGISIAGIGTLTPDGLLHRVGTLSPFMQVAAMPRGREAVVSTDRTLVSQLPLGGEDIFTLINREADKIPENSLDKYIRLQEGIYTNFILGQIKAGVPDRDRVLPREAAKHVIAIMQTAELVKRDDKVKGAQAIELVDVQNFTDNTVIRFRRVKDKNLTKRVKNSDAASEAIVSDKDLTVRTQAMWLQLAYDDFYADPQNSGVSEEIKRAVAEKLAGGYKAALIHTRDVQPGADGQTAASEFVADVQPAHRPGATIPQALFISPETSYDQNQA